MGVFDKNQATSILKKFKITNCEPERLADDVNAICDEYSKAKDPEKPKAQISKIGEGLKGIASSAKTLSGQIARLEKSGKLQRLTGQFFIKASEEHQDFVEWIVTLRGQLEGLEKGVDFIGSTVLPDIKLKSKPIKVSRRRRLFYSRLLTLFGQIGSGDGTVREFELPKSNDGIFLHEPGIAFIAEVVRHFPLMKDEIDKRVRKTPRVRLPRGADEYYQAVATSVARLTRGLNTENEGQAEQSKKSRRAG